MKAPAGKGASSWMLEVVKEKGWWTVEKDLK